MVVCTEGWTLLLFCLRWNVLRTCGFRYVRLSLCLSPYLPVCTKVNKKMKACFDLSVYCGCVIYIPWASALIGWDQRWPQCDPTRWSLMGIACHKHVSCPPHPLCLCVCLYLCAYVCAHVSLLKKAFISVKSKRIKSNLIFVVVGFPHLHDQNNPECFDTDRLQDQR